MRGPVRKIIDFFVAMFSAAAARSFVTAVAREQAEQLAESLDEAESLERSGDPTRQRLGRMLRAEVEAAIAMRRDEPPDASDPPVPSLPGAPARPLALEASGAAATPVTTDPAATTKRRGRPPGRKNAPRPPESSSSPETAADPIRDGEGTTPPLS